MNNKGDQITKLILEQFKQRVLEESIPRICQCLTHLSDEELWRKPNFSSNSVANLILHLIGNARQYILSGIANQEDHRQRSVEFSTGSGYSKSQLLNLLTELSLCMEKVVERLSAQDLILKKDVQCYHMSVTAILIHVIEHFSYHTGQIVYYTKEIKNVDLAFYGHMNLEEKGKN